jgi:predicted DsbA family dithiol-disulfide isomerase
VLLADYFAGKGYDLEAADARLRELTEQEGLEYRRGERTYNSRAAQELAAWAEEVHGRGEIHDRLFRAYFVEQRDISDPDQLAAIAGEAGLDPVEARAVLEERRFRRRVDEDWQLSRRLGVTGVPTFAIGGRGVVGAQPFEALAELVRQAGVAARR